VQWQGGENLLKNASPNFREMLMPDSNAPDGVRAPFPGELFKNPTMAKTFRTLAAEGKKGFYEGRIGEAIIKVCQDYGGHLTLEDLKHHAELGSELGEPISIKFSGQGIGKVGSDSIGYKHGQEQPQGHTQDHGVENKHGVEVWEHPPNGQGIVALMALGILEALERTGKIRHFKEGEHNSTEYLHAVIESLRIAFADATWWVADPDYPDVKVPTKELLSASYLEERAKLFDPKRASNVLDHGSPAHNHCDTVYFAVTDRWGNGISFINSNYGGFGTGIIPEGCGFTLQNRGSNFSLNEGHPNVLAPRKRPYHTIIPAIASMGEDIIFFSVMGGFNQPQAQVQVLLNMLTFNLNPQTALDAPRICIGAGLPDQGKVFDNRVYLEEGISEEVAEGLKLLGHKVEIITGFKRGLFGRGQVIISHREDGQIICSAGSDPRGDGMAVAA
jgi:gamma-glutamyltranspeptidase/glutathione hydrolase